MLKSCLGKIEVKGKKSIIQVELCTLLQSLREDKILTDEEIDECIKDSRLTEAEMTSKLSKLLEDASLEELLLVALLSDL